MTVRQTDVHYWNRDNFEGLAQLADALRGDARLDDLARYCELRERGLRTEAFEALNRFLDAALASTLEARREIVLRVLGAHARTATAHQFLSRPLRQRLLEPVLKSWCESEPGSVTPVAELGLLQRDPELLERALHMERSHDRARACLVSILLGQVDYATHHLVEGRLIGTLENACSLLEAAERHLGAAADATSMSGLAAEAAEIRGLLDDWKAYQENPSGTFPEWCQQRSRAHRWWTVVYHDA